jgi:DNA polymerase III alpha subunit
MDLAIGQERRRQASLQENPKVLTVQDLDEEEKYLGVSLSGHRMDAYQQELEQRGVMTVEQIMSASKLPARFRVAGLLKSKRITFTKKGHKPMAILKLEDATGEFDALVFEAYLEDMRKALDVGSGPVLIRGDRLTGSNREQDQDRLAIRVQQVSRLEGPVIQKADETPALQVELLSPDEDSLVLV